MTLATTWYSGAAVTLPAGKWLVIAQVHCTNGANQPAITTGINDGGADVASNSMTGDAVSWSRPLRMHAVVTPTGSTTYTARAQSASTGSQIDSSRISALRLN